MDSEFWQQQRMKTSLQPVCTIDERPKQKRRPRVVPFLLTFLIMFATWVIFSGLFDGFHLTLGVLSCAIVAYFFSDLLFGEGFSLKSFLGSGLRFLGYIPWLLLEIVKANFHLLSLVFHPRMKEKIDPTIMQFPTSLKGTMPRLTFANSITLTPGTVTVYVSVAGEVTVHSIDRKSAGGLADMEKKVARTFGEL
ncbi:MAG: Na+/H+ antiporter subunit E [Desulfovibrionales bacterium]